MSVVQICLIALLAVLPVEIKTFQLQIPNQWMKPLEMPLVDPEADDNKPEHLIRHYLRDPHDKNRFEITIVVGATADEKKHWQRQQEARMESFNRKLTGWAFKGRPKHLREKPFLVFVNDGHKLFGYYPLVRRPPPDFGDWWGDENVCRIQYTGRMWILISGDFEGWKIGPPPEIEALPRIEESDDDVPPPPPPRR